MGRVKTIWEPCVFRARPSVPFQKVANGHIWFFTEKDWSQECCHGNDIVSCCFFCDIFFFFFFFFLFLLHTGYNTYTATYTNYKTNTILISFIYLRHIFLVPSLKNTFNFKNDCCLFERLFNVRKNDSFLLEYLFSF